MSKEVGKAILNTAARPALGIYGLVAWASCAMLVASEHLEVSQ